ncbi:MAG: hypothetical protein H6Q74_2292 [Firmicutes bacterium]|nr:hypothetical protein [Bacillota bacterium]
MPIVNEGSYETQLGLEEEVRLFLFKKKICPLCGGSMRRKKKFVSTNEEKNIFFHAQFYFKKYDLQLFYICHKCEKLYLLTVRPELIKEKLD